MNFSQDNINCIANLQKTQSCKVNKILKRKLACLLAKKEMSHCHKFNKKSKRIEVALQDNSGGNGIHDIFSLFSARVGFI